eukprot:8450669-Prorocentrum_lima.AAC.1
MSRQLECECQANSSPPGSCQGTHIVSDREIFPARAPTLSVILQGSLAKPKKGGTAACRE